MSARLVYRTDNFRDPTYQVFAIHEYRGGIALVTRATHGGGEPVRHFAALDHLVIQEEP